MISKIILNRWAWIIGGFFLLSLPTLWQISKIFQFSCFYYDSYLDCNVESSWGNLKNSIYLLGIWTILWLAYFRLVTTNFRLASGRLRIGLILLVYVLAFITVPIGTFDPFYYFGSAQAELTQQINPYIHSFTRVNPFATQYNSGEVGGIMYFPLWLMINRGVVWLSQIQIIPAIYLYKLVTTLFFVGCGWVLYQIARLVLKNTDPKQILYLFLLNPLMIFEFVVNAHMDSVMTFWVLLGLWFLFKDQIIWSIMSLSLAVLIKVSALIFVPFFIIWYLHSHRKQLGYAFEQLVLSGLICLIIMMLFFWPYWEGVEIFNGIKWQARWINNTVFAFLHGISSLLVTAIGKTVWIDHWIPRVIQIVLGFVFVVEIFRLGRFYFTVLLNKTKLNIETFVFTMTFFILMYHLFFQRSFLPWYSIVPFAFSLLLEKSETVKLKTASLILTVGASFYYIIQAGFGYGNMGENYAQIVAALVIFAGPIWYLFQNGYLTKLTKL